MNAFIVAAYAAAWNALKLAREAEKQAIYFAMISYKAGERGKGARRLHVHFHEERGDRLEQALRIRRNIRELRAQARAAAA